MIIFFGEKSIILWLSKCWVQRVGGMWFCTRFIKAGNNIADFFIQKQIQLRSDMDAYVVDKNISYARITHVRHNKSHNASLLLLLLLQLRLWHLHRVILQKSEYKWIEFRLKLRQNHNKIDLTLNNLQSIISFVFLYWISLS